MTEIMPVPRNLNITVLRPPSLWLSLFSGILCNMLVCLSVWAAASFPSAGGKVICCYLPMLAFILGGL